MSPLAHRRTDRAARRACGYDRDGLATVLTTMRRRVLAELTLLPSDRLLDVGCATGATLHETVGAVDEAVGIDNSTSMITRAAPAPHATFLIADAEQLPFAARTFTAITCASALHYFTDPIEAVQEMARVLRPDGHLVIGDFLPPGQQSRRLRRSGSAPIHALPQTHLIVTSERRCLTPFGPYAIATATKHPSPHAFR